MFFIISKILSFLTKPIIWIFLIIISAILFKKNRRQLLITCLITFYFFSNEIIVDEFSRLWEIPRNQVKSTFDVGIVLGGIADYDSITKSHNFNKHADRLMDAEQLYHKGIIKKILLSGGNGMLINDGYIESEAMRDYLLANKIPYEDILIENKSRNTKENASNSALLLKKEFKNGKFLLITSAIHMRRAQYCFNTYEINTTPFPTDCTKSYRSRGYEYILFPRIEAFDKWENLIHEWIGYIVYRIYF